MWRYIECRPEACPAETVTNAAPSVEQHGALVRALGLPDYAVGVGFTYVSQGELPGDLSKADLLKTR
jgi:hypothetical protein